jgi:hypothetical protein
VIVLYKRSHARCLSRRRSIWRGQKTKKPTMLSPHRYSHRRIKRSNFNSAEHLLGGRAK